MRYLDLKIEPSKEVENVKCKDVNQNEVDDIITYVIPQMQGILTSLKGYGLSAIQIGIKKNFFIMVNEESEDDEYDVFFNARYFKDGSRIQVKEGCLSYDLGKKINIVKRYKSIKVMYEALDKDEFLIKKTEKAKGMRSMGFQHEINHCNGVTIFTK